MEKLINTIIKSRLENSIIDIKSIKKKPENIQDGYKLQKIINQKLKHYYLDSIGGYKIGCTTKVMQDYLQINNPCAGSIFSKKIFHNQTSIRVEQNTKLGIECEVAVTIGKDIRETTKLTLDKIKKYIKSFHTSIEIVQDRFQDYSIVDTATLIADNFFNHSLVIGKPIVNWENLPIDNLHGKLFINDIYKDKGNSKMILGNPLKALLWINSQTIKNGSYLKEEQIITLGSVIKTLWVDDFTNKYTFYIKELGSCSVEFQKE